MGVAQAELVRISIVGRPQNHRDSSGEAKTKLQRGLRIVEESGKILKETLLEVVDNQLRDQTRPETQETYERLMTEGYSDQEARELIATVLSNEIFEMLKHKKPYDRERYVTMLRRLPRLPWESFDK